MTSIIAAAIPVILQIVGWFIQRSQLSEEAKKRFFEWVKNAGNDMGSTRLMEYGDRQLKWMAENPWVES